MTTEVAVHTPLLGRSSSMLNISMLTDRRASISNVFASPFEENSFKLSPTPTPTLHTDDDASPARETKLVRSMFESFKYNAEILTIKVQVEGCVHDVEMLAWSTVQDLKQRIASITHIKVQRQRLFFRSRLLRNAYALHDCIIPDHDSPGAPLLVTVKLVDRVPDGAAILPSIDMLGQPQWRMEESQMLVRKAHQGLAVGLAPQLALDGTGWTYFLRSNSGKKIAVFKPQNEEPLAPENPRGFTGRQGQTGLRQGILSGEAATREVAAFFCDRAGFFGVPTSVMAEAVSASFNHTITQAHDAKCGSLQQFVTFDETASDVSPSKYPASMVHKIVILDLHIVNTDRNDQNILVRYDKTGRAVDDLIPIDHGYSLPDKLEVLDLDWCWLNWAQLKAPLDDETRAQVLRLDVDRAIRVLRSDLGIREPCLTVMKVVNLLLIRGVGAGLTLFQIASMVCRSDDERPSQLEEMWTMSESLTLAMLDSARVRGKDISRVARRVIKETKDFARLVSWGDGGSRSADAFAAQAAEAGTVLEHAAAKLLEVSAGSLTGDRRAKHDPDVKQAFAFYYLNKLVIQAIKEKLEKGSTGRPTQF